MGTTGEIWNEFSAPLRAFIRRRVRDDHIAEDLLQDVFVRVHNKLDSLSDDERLTAWLFRIARNAIIDHHRRRCPGELDGTEFLEDQHADEVHINQQVGECVSRLAERLPSGYRRAVEMAELNDVPQKEIAQRIGLSLSGTKSRIQRGRKMLKTMLLDCCQFEFDRSGNVLDYQANSSHRDCCSEKKSRQVATRAMNDDPPTRSCQFRDSHASRAQFKAFEILFAGSLSLVSASLARTSAKSSSRRQRFPAQTEDLQS